MPENAIMKVLLAIGLVASSLIPIHPAWGVTCTTSATAMAFGPYQPLSGASLATTATITVTCNPGTIALQESYSIQIGAGTGGSVTSRSMSGPGSRLAYQVYTDALHTVIWGDGSAGTSVVSDSYLIGLILPVTRIYTAYGLIAASLRVGIGSYVDSLIITVTY